MPAGLRGFNSNLILQGMNKSPFGIQLLQRSKCARKMRVPTMVMIINKSDNTFSSRFRYGANLRFLREQNFKQDSSGTTNRGLDHASTNGDEIQVSNFLILKSDLNHIKALREQTDKMVMNDMKSIIKSGPS